MVYYLLFFSRLLCLGKDLNLFFCDLPTRQKPDANGKVLLNTPDFEYEHTGTGASCFMGLEDNLVISSSDDHKLYIWCLPDGLSNGQSAVTRSGRT